MATGLTVTQAMEAVFSEFGCPSIDADEFTTRQYAEWHDMPIITAARQLDKAEDAGRVTSRWVVAEGKRCKGYRLVV